MSTCAGLARGGGTQRGEKRGRGDRQEDHGEMRQFSASQSPLWWGQPGEHWAQVAKEDTNSRWVPQSQPKPIP